MCVPETPSNLPPNCSPDKSNADKTLTEGDLTFVEQPMHCNLKTQASPSSDVSDNTSSVASFLQGHSSPIAGDRDELGHLHSSPMSLSSTSFVEMLSSPERSPLPENLNDFVDSDDPKQAETFSIQNSPNTPILSNPIAGPKQCTDEKRNIESCLNTCIPDIGSPEFRTISSSIYSTKRKDYVATAEVNIRKTAQRKDDSKFVDQATAMEPNKLPGKIEDDSLLDIFSTSMTDSMTEQFLLCKQDIKVDTSPSIDISILSPKSVLTSPPLYSPSSKVKDLVMKKNEIELKLNDDEENMGRGARQSLVFTSENQDVNMDWTKENGRHHGEKSSGEKIKTLSKDVSETTKKQSCALTTNQVNSWPDKCSSPSKDEIDFDQSDRRSHDDITAVNDVDEITKTQTEATPSVDAQSHQKDRSNDQFVTPKCAHKTVTTQTCELADEDENKDGENIYIDNDVDEYIDCFDDGGFNCDIAEYFSYDAYSELDNMVSVDEEQGTSSLMNVDAGTTSNHQSVSRNLKEGITKQEKTSKGTKKRNNAVGGKAGKSQKEVAKKKAKANDIVHTEFKLRDPRTPMLDYSNMATPELKVRLCELLALSIYTFKITV